MYSQVIVGALTGITTFFAVVFAYFYLFKRRIPASSSDSNNQQTARKTENEQREDLENDTEEEELEDSKENMCPITYVEHIPSEVKKAKQRLITKEIEQKMSIEDKERERQIQREQLEAIYKLMEQQDDKFGLGTFSDMSEQMKYYK